MNEKLVTIAMFSDQIEANLAKLKLAAEDIDCFLAGEHATAVYSGIIEQIKLQVRQSDAERAKQILNSPPEPIGPDDFDDDDITD